MPENDHVNWEDVLTRLAGIKALADRAGTLAEAEAASTKMAALLLRYNLSILDVERHGAANGRTVTKQQMHTTEALWRRLLLRGVAEGHLCQAVHQDGTGKDTLVGHAHNLLVAREMYLWLVDEINRLCVRARREASAHDELAVTHPRQWNGSFRLGAASAIYDAYQRLLLEAERETDPTAWALVPVAREEVSALVRELFPTIRTATFSIQDANAYEQGRVAGSQIGLQPQVHGVTRPASLPGPD
jgi:hypothetical protein